MSEAIKNFNASMLKRDVLTLEESGTTRQVVNEARKLAGRHFKGPVRTRDPEMQAWEELMRQ
ncbi:uncharacterized protein EHS24_009048 [Apiotrichum porosum]|uniref:Uncharacterized protein n=1 Tax=Apiotrichum porosum TaxID=105984 RepID=A0A427XNW7_9TREE|nr:uncharacterized protein EHS24_009048 [Apiotrichum porosum]RSH80468.1 hypothetical protein EHS24_009048 [Apiotrichum porosum]